MWQRIGSIIVKEFIQLSRDRRSMALVLLIPIIQMSIFGYALSTDIKNIATVVWDASNTRESRELIEAYDQTEFFAISYYATDYADVTRRIDSGDAKVALVIPPDYAEQLQRHENVTVQFFADGSDPSVGLQALANASLVAQARTVEVRQQLLGQPPPLNISLEPRIWYNPTMQSSTFYLPGLVGAILQNLTMMLTAFAIVRERETGTIEQLNVTPLKRGELIIAKLIPYIIIAYVQAALVLLPAVLIFGMQIQGNLLLLIALTSLFLMFSLGLGLLISTISRTQFQAMQSSMLILLPSILLSGFLFPIESMPRLAQWVSAVLPLTYYLRIIRGIVVKGVGIEFLWQDSVILGVMGVLTLILAASRLRHTLS
ncbi:MAG: ABC transporter permease [Chloroflexota bacterium]